MAVEIHYVVGHMSVEGNKKANEAVKKAAETRFNQGFQQRFTSMVHIGRKVMERKWREANYWFRSRHEGPCPIQLSYYDSPLEMQGPDEAAFWRQAEVLHWYFHLQLGNTVTGTFLRNIGKRESNLCWECYSRSRMDVHHVMFRYAAWQKARTLL